MIRILIIVQLALLIGCINNKEKNQITELPNEGNSKEEVKIEPEQKSINQDSVKIIASMFLYEDVEEGLPYYLEEPDIHEVYETNESWVKNYFPPILQTYELRYYQKLNIAYYLYKIGEPQYFKSLADSTNLNEQEKRVLKWYISNYKMKIK